MPNDNWLMEMPTNKWFMEIPTDILNHILLPFPSATWKFKSSCIYGNTILPAVLCVCVCVCVWIMVCHVKGKTKADSYWKYSAEEDIWASGEEVTGDCIMGSFTICSGGGIWHIWGSREMHIENERERQLGRLHHTQFVDWQQCFAAKFSTKKCKQRQNIAPVWSCQPTAVQSVTSILTVITSPQGCNIHTDCHHVPSRLQHPHWLSSRPLKTATSTLTVITSPQGCNIHTDCHHVPSRLQHPHWLSSQH